MPEIFKNVDGRVLRIIREVGSFADEHQVKAYVVGGFVRDWILKRPNFDIDVVVEGKGIAFAEMLAKRKKLPCKSYRQFGTATISGWDGLHVDCVTARSETYPRPGVLPVVRPSELKDDLFRRDFTINALAVRINGDNFGQCIDLFGGLDDLANGVIRVFHDRSFFDDPTRLLRAVRFEQRLGFEFAPQTRDLIWQAVQANAYRTVSLPRFYREFARGFHEEHPARYVRRLRMLEMLKFLEVTKFPDPLFLGCLEKQIAVWKSVFGCQDVNPNVLYACALFEAMPVGRVKAFARACQWDRHEKKAVISVFSALEEYRSLRRGPGRWDDFQQFVEKRDSPTLIFFRALSSGKAAEYLDQELRARSSRH